MQLVLLQMVLKCADIGHLAVRPRIHMKWAYQLEEEFFRQGDKEKALGMPVSPLMDRATQGGMTRSQVSLSTHNTFNLLVLLLQCCN